MFIFFLYIFGFNYNCLFERSLNFSSFRMLAIIFLFMKLNLFYNYRGYPRGVCQSLQTTFFLWFLDSKACRLPKNGPEACIPKCIFLYPKPADLIFEMPKPADQIFFRGKARFLNKYLNAPIKHIILFTSHIFPQQTNYIFNPSFIDPYLKVEQSLHFYGENCKACRLLF